MADGSRQVVNAYRQLYRGLLHAVQYSKPARYTARDKLRLAFRKGGVKDFDEIRIDRTVEFLQYAARERGIEHRIVKNLLHVWHWQPRLVKSKAYHPKAKSSKDAEMEKPMFESFNDTLRMLNSSMGISLVTMGLIENFVEYLVNGSLLLLYQVFQWLADRTFSAAPPPPHVHLSRPKIAVIGAGLTGVSSAAHCIGHGFDVHIFEAGDRKSLGGIWSRVNNTSGLQIHSIMYRFHPSVRWGRGYPDRQQIVSQITQLWERYGLDRKTTFSTKVERIYKDEKDRWVVNEPSLGKFDGVIAAIGTCGKPKMPHIPGQENFKGPIFHSSQLDGKHAKGKKVLVIGRGASAVEALEFVAHEDAKITYVLARSEKWIIPRNPIIDMLLALNIFGAETIFSWIPEDLLRLFFYRDLRDLAPPKGSQYGIFTETPMVNDDVLNQIRSGKAEWLRGDVIQFEKNGILFNHRAQGVPKGGPGREELIEGDMCIMATGYQRPSLGFLPPECFEKNYAPPNWFLQVFPPKYPSICANNCTYVNAIGTVGNYHIGIYTRFLLMFLVDPLARPKERWMKRWIDITRWIKRRAPGGAFDFFTYSELIYWFVFVILVNPFRWKWAPFVLMGIGTALPMRVVEGEDRLRNGLRINRSYFGDGAVL